MRLRVELDMSYRVGASGRAMLAVEAARCEGQQVIHDRLAVDDATISRIPGENGVGTRTWVHLAPGIMRVSYRAEIAVTRQDVPLASRTAAPIHALPAEALTYLRPSRFCQSDEFATFVNNRFGHLEGGAKIAAIRDWVAAEIAYFPASSDVQTTAVDTFARRAGICRDFAHVVCALARAANIPARYTSVYGLGVEPPDFHAVAQVWLDGGWHLVDASGMCSPDGMAVIGVGRDACDAPFMETEDEARFLSQRVFVRSADPAHDPGRSPG